MNKHHSREVKDQGPPDLRTPWTRLYPGVPLKLIASSKKHHLLCHDFLFLFYAFNRHNIKNRTKS